MPFITLWTGEPFNDDGTEEPVGKTNPLPIIEKDHLQIHEGNMFSVSGKATIAAGATSYFLGITNGGTINFRAGAIVTSGSPCDIYFYENAVVSANGSAITPINRNRRSGKVATLSVYSGPTVTNVGDTLEYGLIPTAGHGHSGGIASLFSGEWQLAQSTNYLISMTNNDTSSIDVGYNFLWYEEGLTE